MQLKMKRSSCEIMIIYEDCVDEYLIATLPMSARKQLDTLWDSSLILHNRAAF